VFAADGRAKLWATRLGGRINAVAISPGTGQWIATACADRTARLYHREDVDGEDVDDHQHRCGIPEVGLRR
jgi:WD40 repeat protein